MRIVYTGVKYQTSIKSKIVITNTHISFWVYDNGERKTIKVAYKPDFYYYTRFDNSGKPYEYVTVDLQHAAVWNRADHGMAVGSVDFQTWDRKELFMSYRYPARPYPRATIEMELDTEIIELDSKSQRALVAWLDNFKTERNNNDSV